ncbi:MAG: helix-turn-helix transcriptional regulator [Erysipelotrichaceae bacterium]|uniref:helix-turn-helix domain-containing protein n=1 Tax=Anaerorhabdus sp. TaxID=1872524 RepID=UPI002FCC84A8
MLNKDELIGDEIRRLRILNGFTQDEFADICKISRAYYGRIERGEHSITLDMCMRITKTFGISLYTLFYNIKL